MHVYWSNSLHFGSNIFQTHFQKSITDIDAKDGLDKGTDKEIAGSDIGKKDIVGSTGDVLEISQCDTK